MISIIVSKIDTNKPLVSENDTNTMKNAPPPSEFFSNY